jgi:hypothetical protein
LCCWALTVPEIDAPTYLHNSGGMARRRALTLAEAAARLGVKPQRINQMLVTKTLSGPDIGPGRAPRAVPRVWESSLAREEQRRRIASERKANQPARSGNVSKPSRASRPATSADNAAVLAMKIRLDTARDALREERQANKRLTQQLADAVAEIQAAQEQADRLDEIADGYSESLTQLSTPNDPSRVT